jgi:Domain of unknown function (DUF3644)
LRNPVIRRRRGNVLERWEVGIVKAMISTGEYNDQDIQSYFTRPTRTINHARIKEIRDGERHAAVPTAIDEDLAQFLATWPNLDPETGLSSNGDELLIKAREAMIAAVHTFNGAGLTFRAEIFVVTSVIAWTYLLHAWFKREGVEYRHMRAGVVQLTPQGADKYLELGACLRHARSPASEGMKNNLKFLLEIRHEIEHRSTSRIDDQLSGKLQASCLNFNAALKEWFGPQYALEKRMPIALQFVTFDVNQRVALKKASDLPQNIEASIDAFENELSEAQYADPAYRYRAAFVPIVKNRASAADASIEYYPSGSPEAERASVFFKEVDRIRYTPTQVVSRINESGFPNFRQQNHTRLWQSLDAKNPGDGWGTEGDYGNWVWYDRWLERVRVHCEEQGDTYK